MKILNRAKINPFYLEPGDTLQCWYNRYKIIESKVKQSAEITEVLVGWLDESDLHALGHTALDGLDNALFGMFAQRKGGPNANASIIHR